MKKRYILTFFILFILLNLLIFISLKIGSVNVSFSNLFGILTGNNKDDTLYRVIWNIRFPRILAAVILGGALSVSGFLLQSFFRNPIAGPYVLGISSGAKLFVALFMILFLQQGFKINSLVMVFAAFLGAMLSTGFVLLLSLKVRNMSMLIVCGILIGYICSAVTDLFVTFASDSNIVNLHNWSLGSFSGMNWNDILIMSFIVFPSLVFVFFLSKPIGAFQLGENYARNMGVNIKFLRVSLILFSSLLSACVTAFAGPISFVGIAVPHLIKTSTKTAKPIILIPGCFFGGAIITLFCDCFARTILAPTEISISSVTSCLLVPVVIFMMIKGQGKREC